MLSSQRFCAYIVYLRPYILAAILLIGAFGDVFSVFAASGNGYALFYNSRSYSGTISPEGSFSGSVTGRSGSVSGSFYDFTGLYDFRIPFNIDADSNLVDKPGYYSFSSGAFGSFIFTLNTFSSVPTTGIHPGTFSLQSFTIENGAGEPVGVIFNSYLTRSGTRYVTNTPISQLNYKSGSCVWTFDTSFSNFPIYFQTGNSEQLYVHVVGYADDLWSRPSLSVSLDCKVSFPLENLVLESSKSVAGELNDIDSTIKDQHKEEIDSAESAGSDLGSTLDSVTDTLSTVEILKLPWTMLHDLYNAVNSDGVTVLEFPSFSLMGQTLWPSYSFDLSTLDSSFPVLFRSVRLVSGIMFCVSFGNYLRSFYVKVFGGSEDVEVS